MIKAKNISILSLLLLFIVSGNIHATDVSIETNTEVIAEDESNLTADSEGSNIKKLHKDTSVAEESNEESEEEEPDCD